MGRYLLLWLLGVPIPILILIWIFGGLHWTIGHSARLRTWWRVRFPGAMPVVSMSLALHIRVDARWINLSRSTESWRSSWR